MLDTYVKIKPAIDFATAEFALVTVKDRMMYGSNGHMSAGAPIDSDLQFVVSANGLDKALAIAPKGQFRLTAKTLFVEEGKAKSRVALIESEPKYQLPDADPIVTVPVDDKFKDSLKILQPYVGESHIYEWRCGVVSTEGKMYATNGTSMIELNYNLNADFMLPIRAVEYVLKRQERVVKIDVCDRSLCLRFEDGSWLKIQRLAKEELDNMPSIISRVYKHPVNEIPQQLRESLEQALLGGAEIVTIDPNGVAIELKGGDANVEGETMVDTTTHWSAPELQLVMQSATHFDIVGDDDTPSPSAFRGENIRGLILRRKKVCDRQ